jgi:hypothetical protein
MWVNAEEVKAYSDNTLVKNRTNYKLEIDIARAEQYVKTYSNNDFSEYETIPENVKVAVILIAEVYANNAALSGIEYKSETIGDYSYTASEKQTLSLDKIDLATLLEKFIIQKPRNSITMRLRKL